jgi:hypothetical protein
VSVSLRKGGREGSGTHKSHDDWVYLPAQELPLFSRGPRSEQLSGVVSSGDPGEEASCDLLRAHRESIEAVEGVRKCQYEQRTRRKRKRTSSFLSTFSTSVGSTSASVTPVSSCCSLEVALMCA